MDINGYKWQLIMIQKWFIIGPILDNSNFYKGLNNQDLQRNNNKDHKNKQSKTNITSEK